MKKSVLATIMKKSLLVAVLYLALIHPVWAADAKEGKDEVKDGKGHSYYDENGYHHVHEHIAILFPWFVQALGVIIFFGLTRFLRFVPYTAVMFLLGTFMGLGKVRTHWTDQLTESIFMWSRINAEVLLLVFLPGLIFKDAFGLNVYLFQSSFVQCLIMAFPMVLAGTVLVALIAFYIFPYGWSFNLAMTFGAILAATDPVAVSALLNEVGAPPRLKMHISGESLLNDGSAIVFFAIFSGLFLNELGIPGLGEEVTIAQGFLKFAQMSIGGAVIGLAFGATLVFVLQTLKRRLNPEENVVQVVATITTAYLCFYVAEAVAHTSGVIAVVFCGVLTRAMGAALINDMALMDNFWVLVEHLLNTVVFALGGVVWGGVVSNTEPRGTFGGRDWGYLIILYLLMTAIRFFLMFAFYPIISRIGLKTNIKETLFMSYGGLRGAVGISLAVALESEVWNNTDDEVERAKTHRLLGMVGGIALLTLFVNGMTAGPLLVKLGLAKSSEVREHILEEFHEHARAHMLMDYIKLLANPVFQYVDFAVIKYHIPQLAKDLTYTEFKNAVLKNKARVPPYLYMKPNVDNVIPYLVQDLEDKNVDMSWISSIAPSENASSPHDHVPEIEVHKSLMHCDSVALHEAVGQTEEMKQLRLIFIEMLRAAYNSLIARGNIDVRSGKPGYVAFTIEQGLAVASDKINKGEPLQDWECTFSFKRVTGERTEQEQYAGGKGRTLSKGGPAFKAQENNQRLRVDVNRVSGFLEAHREARTKFRQEFCQTLEDTTDCEKLILKESEMESELAQEFLDSQDPDAMKHIVAHIMCVILFDKAVVRLEKSAADGILSATEASEDIEHIEHQLDKLRKCTKKEYPGEMASNEKSEVNDRVDSGDATYDDFHASQASDQWC